PGTAPIQQGRGKEYCQITQENSAPHHSCCSQPPCPLHEFSVNDIIPCSRGKPHSQHEDQPKRQILLCHRQDCFQCHIHFSSSSLIIFDLLRISGVLLSHPAAPARDKRSALPEPSDFLQPLSGLLLVALVSRMIVGPVL